MFRLIHERGSAEDFHARALPEPVRPEIWAFEVTASALVLGSTQPEDAVDFGACAAAGVAVVRRRSGGGAVLVEPGALVWFDVVVPRDRLDAAAVGDDVAGSMVWLGGHIADALTYLGVDGVDVHRGPMTASPPARLICFAGLGPGEVTLGGHKLVGVSQRRTRAGSRFQCAVHGQWSPERLLGLLAAPPTVDELPPVAVLTEGLAAAMLDALAAI